MDLTKKLPQRDEIPMEDTWALEDLFPDDESWERELGTVEQGCKTLAAFDGRLGQSGEVLFRYLETMENVHRKLELLANYIMRKADQDMRVAKYQALSGQLMSKLVAVQSATSFETPQLLAISDGQMATFFEQYPALERYRRYLANVRRCKEHVLSEAEEKLLAAAGEMGGAPDTVFSQLTNSDMTFPDAIDAEGKPHALNTASFAAMEESTDRVLRKSAYENVYGALRAHRNTLAALLDAQNKQQKFFAEARRYPSAFEAALDGNEVPTSVYLNLIDAVHRNLDKLHRYVRLRKKLLNVDELHFYDIYAPLCAAGQPPIPFAQAKQTVYDALYPLGDEYRSILKQGFDNRWIDVYPNEGKRCGAYSAGSLVHPFVLLNYTGSLDSEFALVHEMGHSLHSYLSNRNQNYIDSHYVIFVAEVASTCNEALLMEYLRAHTTDKNQRLALINHFLEQFKGTLYRQTMFAEFELNIGRKVAEGETLTADDLCREYKKLNELYFGPDMVVDDDIALEWARIPHFYYNYYVFQYATGYSAAIALSRRILREGESAVKDYLGFLSGGCSKDPISLLRGAGVDMTTTAPVEDALALFGQLLDELESITKE